MQWLVLFFVGLVDRSRGLSPEALASATDSTLLMVLFCSSISLSLSPYPVRPHATTTSLLTSLHHRHDHGRHDDQLSGALTGLTRVRRFCQDDAHVFCRDDQIKQEVMGALNFMKYVYDIFGMTYKVCVCVCVCVCVPSH